MGRPKIPDELKRARGTLQKDYRPRVTPTVAALTELPAPPVWLTGANALAEYDRAGSLLVGLGWLTDAALSTFATYAQLHGAVLDDMAAGRTVKPARTSQVLMYAKAFRLTGTATAAAPMAAATPADNQFAKFKDPNHPWGPQ